MRPADVRVGSLDDLERIVRLAEQLCKFVDVVSSSQGGPFCQVTLAEAHRARVVANNLRPLLERVDQAFDAVNR